MRIPFSKRYRAFPELDQLSDGECKALVALVARRHRIAQFLSSLALTLVGLILFLCGGFVTMVVSEIVGRSQEAAWLADDGWIPLLGVVLSLIIAVVFTSASRNAWLRGKILEHLSTVECVQCEYSLLGLPAHDGVIVCPECGLPFNLAARGLSAADVMARAEEPQKP